MLLQQSSCRNVAKALQEREKEMESSEHRSKVEARRMSRMDTFNSSMRDLWQSQWKHVQLGELPNDTEDTPDADGQGGGGVASRDPRLAESLADIFELRFPDLFDIYLFYSRVDVAESADASASELYRMTDFTWRSVLKDSKIVSVEPGPAARKMLSTMVASRIFVSVNQRRDNLENRELVMERKIASKGYKKGVEAKLQGAVLMATPTQSSSQQEEAPSTNEAESVGEILQGHSAAAGSLYAFTFSEFLEGLVHAALELQALARRPAVGGLTSSYVSAAVSTMLEERLLPFAKRADVIKLRSMLLSSAALSEALDAIKRDIDRLFDRVASAPQRLGRLTSSAKDGGGFPLKAFLGICADAQLTGPQLSIKQVKTIFLSSLELSADSASGRRPLLRRDEFDEALLRLTHGYQASEGELVATRGGGDGSTAATPSRAQTGGDNRRRALASGSRGKDGDARVSELTAELVGKVGPAGEAMSKARTPDEVETLELEATILAKLPIVCGRLLTVG
jgi:hypothetical protein